METNKKKKGEIFMQNQNLYPTISYHFSITFAILSDYDNFQDNLNIGALDTDAVNFEGRARAMFADGVVDNEGKSVS